MKRKLLFLLVVFAALAAGYLFGTQRSAPASDPVRAYTTVAPLSGSVSLPLTTSSPKLTSAPKPTSAPKAKGETYVLNKNTKKFHKPSCSSVKQMKESNKKYFTGDREEVIKQGYQPCGRCHP